MDTFRGRPIIEHELTFGELCIRLSAPADIEALLEEPAVQGRFERDEYMPYWASLWPSALLLADEVARWERPDGANDLHVVELGCGLGLVGVVAALCGYQVTWTDYDDEALAFAERNASLNGISNISIRLIDWRASYADLRADRLLAADVLYETRHLEPVVSFIARHLGRNGVALVSDPARSTADRFGVVAGEHGLAVATDEYAAVNHPDSAIRRCRGRVFRITHAGGSAGE